MYSCTNQYTVCSLLLFLNPKPYVNPMRWYLSSVTSASFVVWNMLLIFQSGIVNHTPLTLTLNSPALEALKSCDAKDLPVCVIISFSLPLTCSPVHLVLTMFRFALVRSVSLSISLHWLLSHQAECVSILWTLIGGRYGWWLITAVSQLFRKANIYLSYEQDWVILLWNVVSYRIQIKWQFVVVSEVIHSITKV